MSTSSSKTAEQTNFLHVLNKCSLRSPKRDRNLNHTSSELLVSTELCCSVISFFSDSQRILVKSKQAYILREGPLGIPIIKM